MMITHAKALVVYHDSDFDGIVSGWIAKEGLTDRGFKVYTFGVNYGEPIPNVKDYNTVMVVDFAWPIDQMQEIDKSCDLIWIDHHKTSVEAHKDSPPFRGTVFLDTSKAACELVWAWARLERPIPPGVLAVGAWDIKDWSRCSKEEATDFQFGLRYRGVKNPLDVAPLCSPLDETSYLDFSYLDTCRVGRICYEWETIQQERNATHFHTVVWEGLKWRVQVGPAMPVEDMWKHSPGDYVGLVGVNYIKGDWVIGLRRIPGSSIDLSDLAKKHGGGGHPGASGFRKKEFPAEFFHK